MKLCTSYLFSLLFFAATANASGILKSIEVPAPQKCLSCDLPAPSNFQAAEVGTTWVRLTWTQNTMMSNRVRTYRASDNFLLNTTIVPASSAELVVTIPTNTECYSVINAICEDGSNSGNEGTSSSFTTIIADIIVSGYSGGNGSPICYITAAGQTCTFGNSVVFPFRIINNTSRGFGLERVSPLHYIFRVDNYNAGQEYQFYCDNNTDPDCFNTIQITVKHNGTKVAVLQVSQQATGLNTLICTQLEPNYTIQRLATELPGGGRSVLTENETPLSVSCPNPVQEVLPLQFNRITSTPVDLRLFAANGQCLIQQHLAEGQQAYELTTASLAPGFYFLRVETEGLTETIKLFKTE